MILSVSISKSEAEFLDNQNLSPSELLQEKIQEQKRIFDQFINDKNKLHNNIKGLQEEIAKMGEFLELIEKDKDYFQWRNERNAYKGGD